MVIATFSSHEHKNITTRTLQMPIVLKLFTTWTCLIISCLHKTTVPRNVPGLHLLFSSKCLSLGRDNFVFVKNVMTFKTCPLVRIESVIASGNSGVNLVFVLFLLFEFTFL